MNKFKQKLYAFMIGRYGIDQLYFGLFGLWCLLAVVNLFVGSFVLSCLGTAVIVFALLRTFSRNRAKRMRENAWFLKLWNPVRNWFVYTRDRIRDRKTARYRKCTHCKAICKLPIKKGKHTVVCPKCGQRFNVRI